MEVKGVVHMHSTHSYDGKLSLSELREKLLARGISFACMTEHTDTLTSGAARSFISECRQLSDDEFVFIPGFEVPYKNTHVLHIGASKFVCQFADAEDLVSWRLVSPLVVLAHPVRNEFVIDETLEDLIDGVEVWNQQYEGKRVPRPRSISLLESLRKKHELLAFGGLDLHRSEHLGSPVISLEVPYVDEDTILEQLQAGEFSFGTAFAQFTATEPLHERVTWLVRWNSFISISIIMCGKWVNKTLAQFGFKLPKLLVRTVRAGV